MENEIVFEHMPVNGITFVVNDKILRNMLEILVI